MIDGTSICRLGKLKYRNVPFPKVVGDGPEITEVITKDDWGMRYPPGADIVRGHFFERDETKPGIHQFNLIDNKEACVYSATVRYICPPLTTLDTSSNQKQVYCLTDDVHMEILNSLDGF